MVVLLTGGTFTKGIIITRIKYLSLIAHCRLKNIIGKENLITMKPNIPGSFNVYYDV